MIRGAIQELFERRDLLYTIAWREIKVKYKQSVMGMLWAVLMPLAIEKSSSCELTDASGKISRGR